MSTLPNYAQHDAAGRNAAPLRAFVQSSGLSQVVWCGNELGSQIVETVSSGWPELDKELPGSGWPRRSVTEVLTAQPSVVEWRLLAPGLRPIIEAGGQVVVIGPPRNPHLPGLTHMGLNDRQLVWIKADVPSERLWATEQLIKSNSAGAIIAWLPKARPDQLRRLQVCSQGCEAPVFLCRPEVAQHESSAAPLRVQASAGLDWELNVQILKRRGPQQEHSLVLASVPGGLASVLTPRLRRPSSLITPEVPHVVGRPATAFRPAHVAA
ncbi:translesion DNA synthesis-associated protein ImuA [Delftia sp. ZNC0008]|uniref:translesion DNA synthesis-associated protein ImuA n=1 Tax=Delftia sp. ZNC0008 TaxID=1339242 RepID=UPI0012E01D2C|nr:translesion DNA synthesis-associated protein ImuA [Delftia sp. ZNC0008]